MKKLVSILAIAITVPALATDIYEKESKCDNATLNTYSAPVDMEAKWTANTINLQWYDDANDSTPTNTMCTYNTTIALPTEPSKPGYNFTGWQLRPAVFDLSTLAEYIESGGNASISRSVPNPLYNNGNPICRNGKSSDSTCSGAIYSDLDNGEWKVPFDYGTVRGVALCSTQRPTTPWYNNNNTFTSDHFATTLTDETGENGAIYCWCKPTGFAEPNSSTYTNVASPSWVFDDARGDDADGCAYDCAYYCAVAVYGNSDFRRALYGITQ